MEAAAVPSLADLQAARARVGPHVHRTPVLTSRTIDETLGASLLFKCENFQRVGAFKFRGAINAVLSLSPAEAARGVATHSSGNHAQAVALAASLRGIPAHIVMPEGSSRVKVAAVRGYGGRVILCANNQESRERTLADVARETGAVVIHPYDDAGVIAGQATACMELLDEASDMHLVLVPVGGGGLASGTALACRYLDPGVRVIAVEPEAADDAFRSVRDGVIHPSVAPKTIADGLRTSLGRLTFEIIRSNVSEIVTVSERSIVEAMRLVWERMKIVIEPSAAVPVAALLEGKVRAATGGIGVILSGGNVDLDSLPWQGGLRAAEATDGREAAPWVVES